MSNILKIAAAGVEAAAPSDYQIERSLRFNPADSAYLNRTPASSGNRKTWTWSGWVKRSAVGTGLHQVLLSAGVDDGNKTAIRFDTDDSLRFVTFDSASITDDIRTTAIYRDVSAWYHIVFVSDTTQATNSDRAKIYVNGVQVTSLQTSNYPTLNFDTDINLNALHTTGKNSGEDTMYLSGYLAEVHFIDGQALTPSDFGETDATTGVWKPKAYAGTYGTNGFHLDFSDNTSTTTIGYDAAGSNNWTANNFSVAAGAGNDSLVDTPTPYGTDTGAGGEVRGNYCTLNPIRPNTGTLSNGNLNCVVGNAETKLLGTIGMSSGKWYWEMSYTDLTADGRLGIATGNTSLTAHVGQDALSWAYQSNTGNKVNNQVATAYGNSYTTNDVIGVAFDADNGDLFFYKNGTVQNSGTAAFTGLTSGPYFPAFGDNSAGASSTFWVNFGQRPFAYTAPSGFKALCTQNLPDPTIVQGDDYFNTVLYTGNGSTQSITGVGFQPDLVWLKNRASATWWHNLFDAVRGVGNRLASNDTAAESFSATSLTAFNSDGFSVGSDNTPNNSGDAYVAWNWNAGGSNATNTDGTITSTVRANTTAGFSVLIWSGTGSNGTIGHGLGVAPGLVIVKNRNNVGRWRVWHKTFNGDQFLYFDGTEAVGTQATLWNSTVPSATVISAGTSGDINWSGRTYVGYAFAEVEGYSKFGSYTGNGSADGPFVYANHRPAFIMVKRTDSTSNWTIIDTKREGYNVDNDPLYPNLSNAEGTTDLADILSNGFKLRSTDASVNASGGTYIFMSLASNPFKYSLAR